MILRKDAMDATTVSIPVGEAPIRRVSPERLTDELLLVDCQQDIHECVSGHVPGAVYLNDTIFRVHVGTCPGRWINFDAAMWLLRQVGLQADLPVVVFTGSGTLTGCSSYIGDSSSRPWSHTRSSGAVMATSGFSMAGSTPRGRRGTP